jgi:hypothetical protein
LSCDYKNTIGVEAYDKITKLVDGVK